MKREFALLLALAAGAVPLSLSLPSALAASTTGQRYVVSIDNMRFGRLPAGLKVGDTIVWANRDTVPHTVTARNRSFDIRLHPGQSTAMRLTKAGNFPFYCIYHPAMRGTLLVAGG